MTVTATDRNYARSVVYSTKGIAATSHVLASQAAAQILARGGSAVDAAVAANAVLSVVEPMMCGPGGDAFLIYSEAKTGKLHGLNSSGYAPRGMTLERLRSLGFDKMPQSGIHSVTVPGAVAGWWAAHQKFGKLPWQGLFAAAIEFAENGHPVHEVIAGYWSTSRLKDNAEAMRVFLPGGKTPKPGEMFRNPDMAAMLRAVAAQGPDAFYKGEVARKILAASQKLGGTMSAADLAEFQPEWVEPISTEYRGWRVYELPPNGQGMAALMMLNLMEQTAADPKGPNTAADLHKKIESMKLAYADTVAYDADPRFAKVPVKGLLSKDYAKERAKLIDPAQANCDVKPGSPQSSDTTYFAIVDREGNIASWIQSIYSGWGSGVVPEGTGMILQNRGAGFSMDPASPNVVAPRKRPFHTIIPALMEKDGVRIGFGIMGGPNQPLAHAQFASNIADYGQNIQQALETPRFTKDSALGCEVQIESRMGVPVLNALRAMGHKLDVRAAYSTTMGRGAAVGFNPKTGIKQGAADPRADGAATPEP